MMNMDLNYIYFCTIFWGWGLWWIMMEDDKNMINMWWKSWTLWTWSMEFLDCPCFYGGFPLDLTPGASWNSCGARREEFVDRNQCRKPAMTGNGFLLDPWKWWFGCFTNIYIYIYTYIYIYNYAIGHPLLFYVRVITQNREITETCRAMNNFPEMRRVAPMGLPP